MLNTVRHRTGNSIWDLLHSAARVLGFWVRIPLKLIELCPRLFCATGQYSIQEFLTYISE